MSMTREEAAEVLGVSYGASQKQVNDAYRRAIAKYHPDANRNKSPEEQKHAETMFKKCAQAKKVMLSKQPEQATPQQAPQSQRSSTSAGSGQRSQQTSANTQQSYSTPSNTRTQQPRQQQSSRPVHNTAHSFHDNIPKTIDDAERQIAGFYKTDSKRRYSTPLDLIRVTPSLIPSIILLAVAIMSFLGTGEGFAGLFNGNPLVPFMICMVVKMVFYDFVASYYVNKLIRKAKIGLVSQAGIESVLIAIIYLAISAGKGAIDLPLVLAGMVTGILMIAIGFVVNGVKNRNKVPTSL